MFMPILSVCRGWWGWRERGRG